MAAQSEASTRLAKTESGLESVNPGNILPEKRRRTEETQTIADENKPHTRVNNQGELEARLRDTEYTKVEGRKLYNQLLNLKDADGRQLSIDFLTLPGRSYFPDYYQLIKKPIAFDDIRNKLDRNEYRTMYAVKEDFNQMFVNAKRYNMPGSPIFIDAKALHKKLKQCWSVLTGQAEDGDDDEEFASSKKQKKKDKGPTLKSWLNGKLKKLLEVVDPQGRSYAEFFLELPHREALPDYYKVITSPMAFNIVREKIKKKQYQNHLQFVNDVNTIFANAKWYNQDASRIWKDATYLERIFAELMREQPPAFVNKSDKKLKINVASGGTADPNQKLKLRFGLQTPASAASPGTADVEMTEATGVESGNQYSEVEDGDVSEVGLLPPARRSQRTSPGLHAPQFNFNQNPSPSGLSQSFPSPQLPAFSPPVKEEEVYPPPMVEPDFPRVLSRSVLGNHTRTLLPYFTVFSQQQGSQKTDKRNLVNSVVRQHTILISADTGVVEIEAFSKSQPETPIDVDDENQNRPSKTRASRTRANDPSPPKGTIKLPKYEFRVEARPVGVECNQVDVSGKAAKPNLAAKFSIQPGEGTSTLEIGVKLIGSEQEEEVYRVFVTKVGM